MSNGLIFLWFAWILWVMVTFFMRKTRKRTYFACLILLSICGSNITWHIVGYQVTLTFVILFIGGLLFFHYMARSLYLLFSAFIICLGYTGVLFWEQLTPVWMFLPRFFLISLVLLIGITMLTKPFEDKLAIGLIGIMIGEMYYSIILSHYSIRETIGDMAFFDMLFTLILMITVIEIIRKARVAYYLRVESWSRTAQVQKHNLRKTLNG